MSLTKCQKSWRFISAQDLLNEVEKDQIRFMMLNRSNDVELDFDFDKVKEKSKDNPVFTFNMLTLELILY